MENIQVIRHSLSHILAYAVNKLYKNVKFGIGPAIDNGFYYDFDFEKSIPVEDLLKIEKEMNNIIKQDLPFVRKEISKADALVLFKDQPYKLSIIEDLKEAALSVYTVGDFTDLCAGPHVSNTKELRSAAFKLTKINGAYFKGDEKNKMLSRIYALAFASSKELKKYEFDMAEALKRDHVKLGKELEFFTTVDVIGKGLPVMLPKGAKAIQLMQRFVEDEEAKRGYILTKTPLMAKSDLYKISQHWDHYKDGMFILGNEETDSEVFALRPMTCPFQYQVFLNKTRSYRDLPMRLSETSTLFRNEASGEMHGLTRVRQFTISEAHIICTPEQIEEEFKNCVELSKFFLTKLGLIEDITFRFSRWDKNNKDKYVGDEKDWERVENKMKEILDHLGIVYEEGIGEAAFYGPKLDLQLKNVYGKEDTLITAQLDFSLAKLFGMEYTNKEGKKQTPFIVHRTSIGCYERTLAALIEKFAGVMPYWLSLVQVGIVPVTEEFNELAQSIETTLQNSSIRAKADCSEIGMGAKINNFRKEKTPYTLVVGQKEKENNTVSVKIFGGQQVNDVLLKDFITTCQRLDTEHELNLATKFN